MSAAFPAAEWRPEENAAVIKGYESTLKRYFSKRVRSRWEVDDLVQEALIRFYRHRGQETVNLPQNYLFRIANNLLVDMARRRAVAEPVLAFVLQHHPLSSRAEQEDQLLLADLRSELAVALSELPPKCREAFVLRRFHDADTPTIAKHLNVSHRMVQKYLIRAMEFLHERLVQ